jgi:hypothetical protein
MKRTFRAIIDEWKNENPMESLERNAMPWIVHQIWKGGISVETIVRGAKSTGLYPLDVNWTAKNTHKLRVSETVSQPTIPGTLAFASYSSSLRSLSALDLAMSSKQTSEIYQRVMVAGKMPKLNAIGEGVSQARLLNSEARIKKLFALHDLKSAEIQKKAEKRKERESKRDEKRAAKLKKQHAGDQKLSSVMPLIEAFMDLGFQDSKSHPTIRTMRTFAKKQRIAIPASATTQRQNGSPFMRTCAYEPEEMGGSRCRRRGKQI